MSKSTAWGIASVSPDARRLAEQAASRAGLALEEWLDRAIAEHASSARSGNAAARGNDRDDARRRGHAMEDPAAPNARPAFQAHYASARELQERLRASAGPLERRRTMRSEEVAAQALASIDSILARADDIQALPNEAAPQSGELDAGEKPPALRSGRGSSSELPPLQSPAAAPSSFDLESAVSQIASRRRALDARQAHDGMEPRPSSAAPGRTFDPEAPRVPPGAASAGIRASSETSDPIRQDLRAVAEKLDALRLQWSEAKASDRELASMQNQMAALRRGLSGMAPRDAVVALERALGELAQRVSTLGREQRFEALLAPIDIPEVLEAVRRQMEEVHDLLLAAARRSVPLERLESQIADLADQVERLAASASTGFESEPMAELLAAFRQFESGPAPAVLASIERRLDDILGRLDKDAAALTEARSGIREFDGAARRIDSALQESQVAAKRVEAQLSELLRDLGAKLEAAEIRDRERPQIAPILSEIAERLDRLPAPERGIGDLASIDHALQSLMAAVEAREAPAFDRRAADELAETVAQRLEDRFAGRAAAAEIAERFAQLDGRLEAMAGRLGEAGALERAARDLLQKLEDADRTAEAGPENTGVAEQLSAFRREQAAAERRTEGLLQGIQDLLDRLIASDDAGASPPPRRRSGDDGRTLGGRARETAAASAKVEDELLFEPGSGAPPHFRPGREPAQTIGPRTNPAVSAHIAAARRAAQSALAESSDEKRPAAWPQVEKNVQQAKRFCARHKRSLLLAAALVLALGAFARLMVEHAPLLQKSELDEPRAKAEAARVFSPAPSGAGTIGAAPVAVDAAPTASIARSPGSVDSGPGSGSRTPDLLAAMPSGTAPTLREAVLDGSPAAEYDLAQRLFDGRGLPQDQRAAAFWFERAASAGFAPAEFRLGALYQKGAGVVRDAVAAKRWYAAAAQAGNARAAHNLGVMDAEPAGEKADYAEAAKWFRRAAEMGVRDSQYNLAVLYARGLGVEQDLRRSWMWFSLAAAQGDVEAARKRNEVAEKMDPGALAAAADLLSTFKTTAPDPAANDVAAKAENGGERVQPPPATAAPSPSRDAEPRSGS